MTTKSKILIRTMLAEDIASVVKIHKDCVKKINAKFYPPAIIKEWLKQISVKNVKDQFKNSEWVVLFVDNKIFGFAQFDLQTFELFQINISPKYAGQGYGRTLYEYVEKVFNKNYVKWISLNSTLNAVKFYKKLGFKEIKKIKFKFEKEFVDMVKMRKQLV